MLNRRGPRRLHSVLFAVLLVACVLPLSAGPASADPILQGCPTDTPGVNIDTWNEIYRGRGVTFCEGTYLGAQQAFVQVVDLAAGAKMRLVSEVAADSPQQCTSDTRFNKRTADEWFISMASFVSDPPIDRLFSTTNASFFVETSGSTTALSLPETRGNLCRSAGYALNNHSDFAWDAAKRDFSLAENGGYQYYSLTSFPQHYAQQDVYTSYYDQIVGFAPMQPSGGDTYARRTALGIGNQRVYIVTTIASYSLGEVQAFMNALGVPGDAYTTRIQLDGGGSTQTHNILGYNIDSSIPFPIGPRAVPEVFAVYLAPICDTC